MSKKSSQFLKSILPSSSPVALFSNHHCTHLIFGSNTDVGKTLLTAGLVRTALSQNDNSVDVVSYIKPLQCGGSDEAFVSNTVLSASSRSSSSSSSSSFLCQKFQCRTLYKWETPASPHYVSRIENHPIDDSEVIASLQQTLGELTSGDNYYDSSINFIETAGGVLSPGPSSPQNNSFASKETWGWSTQADLFRDTNLPTILIGDGRLGGISATLCALESLVSRNYAVHGIAMLESEDGMGNVEALREYLDRKDRMRSGDEDLPLFRNVDREIVSFPPIPPLPEPLDDWYDSNDVISAFRQINDVLEERWRDDVE